MNRFSIKPEVYFGFGALDHLAELQKSEAFIITDPILLKSGLSEKVFKILKSQGINYNVFCDITADPPIEQVGKGVEMMLKSHPDVVIALGGGTAIDTAKSILKFTGDLVKKGSGNYIKPLFIAIPTTSGTGSEVSSFSVLTVSHKKLPIVHPDMLPDIAILDPELVITVPPQVTADTAIDALTHALEAYVSTGASDFSDALAEKAIKLIFDFLLEAYHDGSNLEARERLHNASCLAGMAFTNAYLGINHSIAHALGGSFSIPHGKANAVLLSNVIAFNANLTCSEDTKAAARYTKLAELLGLPAHSVQAGVSSLICAIRVLLHETNTPSTLKDIGVDKDELTQRVQELAMTALADKCTVTNPRIPKCEELQQIIISAYEG